MLKSKKFRKIAGSWVKVVVWFIAALAAVVAIQSGAFKASEAEASIDITATVNDPVVDMVQPSTGPMAGNVRVSIRGTNFTNVIAVTFGGVNVQSFSTLSDSLISAVIPPGQAGPVRVVVITEDKAGALDNGFTYVAQATPTTAPTATPNPTATTGPLTLAATPTGASDTAAPVTPTPTRDQLTATPGGSSTPGQTSAPGTVSTTPGVALTLTPEGTPMLSTTLAATTGATTTTPTETARTATPTTPVSPVVTSNVTPESSATPEPAATVARATPIPEETTPTSTPANTATITPGSLFSSPTPDITGSDQTATATPTAAVDLQPSETTGAVGPTPATATPLPTATAIPVTANSVPATISATPGIDATPTLVIAPTATPELTVMATPTAILAPTPTTAASPRPSPTAAPVAPPTITLVSPDQGTVTGGTTVTITGSNFSQDTEVTFGGLAPASVIINSPNQITVVTAPQQAGPVSIVVKNEGGLASLANGFTYAADSVVISQQPTNFNYSGKLNGKTLVLKSSFSVGVRVSGANLAGWRLVARSTVLSSGSASLPVSSHTIQNVRVVSNGGIAPDNNIRYPMTFPVDNATIFAAAPGTGTGETILTFETQLVIPPGIPAGNYKLSLNVDVVSGDVS